MFKQLFTVQQASQYLQTSTDTLRAFIRAGKLPARKIGRKYVLSDSDLQDFVESGNSGKNPTETKQRG